MKTTVREMFPFFFQPDPVLPAQYLATLKTKDPLEAEKKLMLAVLEDAIVCFQKHGLASDHRGKRIFLDAQEWIMAKDGDWLLSFENICEVLGLDPGYIRHGLLLWRERFRTEHSRDKHRLTPGPRAGGCKKKRSSV